MSSKNAFKNFPNEKSLMKVIMHTSSTVWKNELTKGHIDAWLSNFQGEAFAVKNERLMALLLLRHFTFYNQEEVTHLCRVIYRDLIHRLLISNTATSRAPIDVIDEFLGKATITTFEQASGSGGFIAYIFRHANKLPMSLFSFSIDKLSSAIENVIIIDDVTLTPGSGGHLFDFFTANIPKHPGRKFFLLTLISTEDSIDFLRKTFNVEVVTAIKLDSRDKCFHPESDIFSSRPNLRAAGQELAECYGRKIMKHDPLGYQNGQSTFGFFYNTPDNTLPIFWGQVGGWEPIISRYHKNYNGRRYLENERFI